SKRDWSSDVCYSDLLFSGGLRWRDLQHYDAMAAGRVPRRAGIRTGGVSKGTVEVVDSAGTGQSYWSEPQKEYPGWRGGARPRSVGVFVVRFGRFVVLEPVPGAEPYSD